MSISMYDLIAPLVALVVGSGLGWYVKGRGWFGVKVDASNVVKEVSKVSSEVQHTVNP